MENMKNFVNRKEETFKLKQIIDDNLNVGIIFSHEGIGKSCFIEHFISEDIKEDPFIIIKNEELGFIENVEKYYFADKLCEKIIEESKTNVVVKIIKQLKKINIKPNVSFSYGWFNLSFELNEKFRLLQDVITIILKSKTQKLIIYIDNINKIDFQSLIFMSQLIEQTSNIFFLLEVTLKIEENSPVRLIEFFRNHSIKYNFIELHKLSYEHAYQVMQNNNIANIREKLNNYDLFDGNLKKLILMNATKEKTFIELDENEKFIIEFINLVNYKLTSDTLLEIIDNYPGSNKFLFSRHTLNECIYDMRTLNLIDIDSSNKLYITLLGKNYVKKHMELLIIEMLSDYYIPVIINDKSQKCLNGLKILIPLLTKNADSRLKKILPSLHNNIVISRCNKEIVDNIYNSIDLNADNNEIRIELIKLYIGFGDYKSAFEKIKYIENESDESIVLYATLISHLIPADKAEEKIKELLSRVINKEEKSAIFTCIVALYMKIKSSNKVIDYVNDLKKKNEITETDVNIINKNISIYYNYNTAIEMLKNSLSYFDSHNMGKLSIATKITLSTRLAQNGYTQDAKKILKKILNTPFISELDYIYSVNNEIAIMMLENNFQNIKEKELIKNYSYIQDEYTQLLTVNNLLIYYSETNNFDKAQKYADILEKIGNTKYKFESYLLLTNLNLRCYYKKIDNKKALIFDKQLHYLYKKSTDNNIKEYIKCVINDIELSHENDLFFLSQHDYRPAFLGHWIINDFDY